jgi:soluble lytic murein transglycosylase
MCLQRRLPFLFLVLALSACALATSQARQATGAPALTPLATAGFSPTPTAMPTATPAPDDDILLGDHALRNGDYAAAAGFYNAALAAGVESEHAAFFLARVMYQTGDYPGARAMLENLIASSPNGEFTLRADFLLGEVAAAQEDWTASVAAYQNFLTLAPGVLTEIVQERVGDSSLAAGLADQAAQAYAAAAAAADPANRLRLMEKQADTLSGARQTDPAMLLYEQVLAAVANDNSRARLQRKIGGELIALGRVQEGFARYEAALQYPASYYAFLCLSDLVDAGFSVNPLTRGIVDYYAGVYDTAAVMLTDYLTNEPAEPAEAFYYRGLSYLGLEQAQAALADLDASASYGPESGYWDSALFESAYIRRDWLNDSAGAISVLVGLADAMPGHRRAADALYTAARTAEMSGDLAGAAQLWARMAQDYPADTDAAEAQHQAGIALYRLGDYAGAESAWSAAMSSGNGWIRSRALFWTARAREKRGDAGAARTFLEQAAAASPTDYYSERAADILDGLAPYTRVKEISLDFDIDAEFLQAEAWVQSVFPAAESMEQRYAAVRNDPRLLRGRILWDLGLADEARSEFDGLWRSAANDPAGSLYLSRYLAAAGYYAGALQAARKVLDAAGMNDFQTLAAPAYFNHVRFGPYYADLYLPQAANYGLDPLLLFALTKVESFFDASIGSYAGALGLMQLMPATAQHAAGRIGLAGLTDADLYRPMINIPLGAAYLAEQRDGFGGNLFMALAAYNGGPSNVAAWAALAGGDDELFVEVIRFEDTRNYVRWIYENYDIYRDIYQVG